MCVCVCVSQQVIVGSERVSVEGGQLSVTSRLASAYPPPSGHTSRYESLVRASHTHTHTHTHTHIPRAPSNTLGPTELVSAHAYTLSMRLTKTRVYMCVCVCVSQSGHEALLTRMSSIGDPSHTHTRGVHLSVGTTAGPSTLTLQGAGESIQGVSLQEPNDLMTYTNNRDDGE